MLMEYDWIYNRQTCLQYAGSNPAISGYALIAVVCLDINQA